MVDANWAYNRARMCAESEGLDCDVIPCDTKYPGLEKSQGGRKKRRNRIRILDSSLIPSFSPTYRPAPSRQELLEVADNGGVFSGSNRHTRTPYRGQLKLHVYVNYGLLTVHIKESRHFTTSCGLETNAFVRLSLVPDDTERSSCKTVVKKDAHAHCFDEKFSFELIEGDMRKRLLISAWHKPSQHSPSEFLGCMSFGVKHVIEKKTIANGWYYLLSEYIGRRKHLQVQSYRRHHGNELNTTSEYSQDRTRVPIRRSHSDDNISALCTHAPINKDWFEQFRTPQTQQNRRLNGETHGNAAYDVTKGRNVAINSKSHDDSVLTGNSGSNTSVNTFRKQNQTPKPQSNEFMNYSNQNNQTVTQHNTYYDITMRNSSSYNRTHSTDVSNAIIGPSSQLIDKQNHLSPDTSHGRISSDNRLVKDTLNTSNGQDHRFLSPGRHSPAITSSSFEYVSVGKLVDISSEVNTKLDIRPEVNTKMDIRPEVKTKLDIRPEVNNKMAASLSPVSPLTRIEFNSPRGVDNNDRNGSEKSWRQSTSSGNIEETPKAVVPTGEMIELEFSRSETGGFGLLLAETRPVRVLQTKPGSPCYVSGLRRDDVILAIDGKDVSGLSADTVARALRQCEYRVKMTVQRMRQPPDILTGVPHKTGNQPTDRSPPHEEPKREPVLHVIKSSYNSESNSTKLEDQKLYNRESGYAHYSNQIPNRFPGYVSDQSKIADMLGNSQTLGTSERQRTGASYSSSTASETSGFYSNPTVNSPVNPLETNVVGYSEPVLFNKGFSLDENNSKSNNTRTNTSQHFPANFSVHSNVSQTMANCSSSKTEHVNSYSRNNVQHTFSNELQPPKVYVNTPPSKLSPHTPTENVRLRNYENVYWHSNQNNMKAEMNTASGDMMFKTDNAVPYREPPSYQSPERNQCTEGMHGSYSGNKPVDFRQGNTNIIPNSSKTPVTDNSLTSLPQGMNKSSNVASARPLAAVKSDLGQATRQAMVSNDMWTADNTVMKTAQHSSNRIHSDFQKSDQRQCDSQVVMRNKPYDHQTQSAIRSQKALSSVTQYNGGVNQDSSHIPRDPKPNLLNRHSAYASANNPKPTNEQLPISLQHTSSPSNDQRNMQRSPIQRHPMNAQRTRDLTPSRDLIRVSDYSREERARMEHIDRLTPVTNATSHGHNQEQNQPRNGKLGENNDDRYLSPYYSSHDSHNQGNQNMSSRPNTNGTLQSDLKSSALIKGHNKGHIDLQDEGQRNNVGSYKNNSSGVLYLDRSGVDMQGVFSSYSAQQNGNGHFMSRLATDF